MAALELAAQHESRAEAGADGEEHEVVDTAGDSESPLAESCEVDVVLDADRRAEALLEIGAVASPVEPGNVRREPHGAVALLDDARYADDHLVDQLGVEGRGAREVVAKPDDRLERARRGQRPRARHPAARGSFP